MSERCVCLHSKDRHELPGFDGDCVAEGCRCTEYRPRHPESQSVTSRVEPKPARIETVEQLVEAARETGDKRALLVIGRLQSMTAELHALVAAHRANQAAQAARERDAQYEARLAALASPAKAAKPVRKHLHRTRGAFPCREPGCDRISDTAQGRAAHERNAHQNLGLVCDHPGCERTFRTRSSWVNHRAQCSGALYPNGRYRTGSITNSTGTANLTGRNA